MRHDPPLLAGLGLWLLWGATWLIAARWHHRTAGRAAAGPTRAWLALAAAGFAGLFAPMPGADWPWIVPPAAARWASVALIAGGLGFAWWARVHLGRLWSGGIVTREGHRIVRTGPYALVRHPIYTGLFAGAIGLAMLRATPLAGGGALLVILAFTGKARAEERFLGERLGSDAYAGYRQCVPMLLPIGPWRTGGVAKET